MNSLAYGNSQFVAVGWANKQDRYYYGYTPEQALLLTSSDGATWSEINPEATSGFPSRLASVTHGHNQYMAIGQSKKTGGMYENFSPANIVVVSRAVAENSCKATNIGNGTIEFEATFTAARQYVEIFVRKNGLQNVAQNIVDNVVHNDDGTVTYKLTRGGYTQGDVVEYRCYRHVLNGTKVFTPGPEENIWNSLVLDK